jgi:hypothetical protein
MGSSELAVIGLTCNLVGVFFLANSIIFRRPRKVIEEFFDVGKRSLTAIRDYALNKMQVILGFLFLNAGFVLQAFSHREDIAEHWTVVGVGISIVVVACACYFVGAVYSRRSFKRYMREFFKTHAWSFQDNMTLTKEIGVALGIPHTNETTVEDYARRVREALGVDAKAPGEAKRMVPGGQERGRTVRNLSGMR